MPVTVTVGDEFAEKLKLYESQVPQILELGLREFQARGNDGFPGVRSVLEQLASLPSPEEVLALRPAPALLERMNALLEKNSQDGLSLEEQCEWEQYRELEHLVRLAKAAAHRKLQGIKSA